MQPQLLVAALVTFLHDLFTVVWIGGLFTLALTLMPAARDALGQGPQLRRLLESVQRRQSILAYISIVGLLITGLLLARRSPAYQGLFSMGNTYSAVLSIKHVLTLLMVAVTLLRSVWLDRMPADKPETARLKMALMALNLALGVLVLMLSGLSATIASAAAPPIVGG